MGAKIAEFIQWIDTVVWGVPLMVAIMGTGIFLTIRLRGIQVWKLLPALKFAVSNEKHGEGDVSSFGALCTALAATIGTGNIVGVATAITLGGPGALFWMIVAAFFGMATKYAEGVLAIKYRRMMPAGHILGGPFCYIEDGMGKKWKPLAQAFAVFGALVGAFGIGTATQMNGIATAVQQFADPEMKNTVTVLGNEISIFTVIAAVVVTALVGFVIIGGISRIAKVTEKLIPTMAILYIGICVVILIFNFEAVPGAIKEIFASAFGLRAAAGGVVGAIMAAMSSGVARGIFSNEAGLGSAPIAAAAAMTKEPVRQGLVSMTGTFIDTIIVCNLTGLTIMVTGAYKSGLQGAAMTSWAFSNGLPWADWMGAFIIMVCLALFAMTTILGWDYYGERCFEYLTDGNMGMVKAYRVVYLIVLFIGPFLSLDIVWCVADILNALMAIPNLIALLALSGIVVAETKSFLKREKEGKLYQ